MGFVEKYGLRAKDLRKNVTIFQKGGSTHVPPTLLVIRVVLLHMLYGVLNPLIPQLYVCLYSLWSFHWIFQRELRPEHYVNLRTSKLLI